MDELRIVEDDSLGGGESMNQALDACDEDELLRVL